MATDPAFLGAEGYGPDDRNYQGSRFADVREAIFRNTYYKNWGASGEAPLPIYDVTLQRVLFGLFNRSKRWQFRAATERAVDSHADLRWGEDGQGFRRLVHPNGVCLFGNWIIDQPTPYSGYFKQGSKGLIVGRYSTCCTECRRGSVRSLSLVGKIYPTEDVNHPTPLRPANFITQEDIGGDRTPFINDAILRNAPNVTPWRRGWGTPILLITGLLFKFVDREPTIRQLYQVAELGKPANEQTLAPTYMQLRISNDQPRVGVGEIDLRDEVLMQLYPHHEATERPSGKIVFDIEVTDDSKRSGILATRRIFPSGWKNIGRIEFTEGAVSYNGDFVLHFPHPAWRKDRNEPKSKFRPTRSK